MINLFWSGLLVALLLSGCGWDGTATRNNDFTPLTSIEIVAISSTIAAHTSTRLSVKGNFSGLYTRDITDQATWSSDSPSVAGFTTLTSPSRVTGLVPGAAILTATVGSITTNFNLTVSPATIATMTITPANPSIAMGLNTQFAASGTFSDSTTQDLTFDAAWSSSAPDTATVSDSAGTKGFAQAMAVGSATISATFDGISGTTLLTVTEAVLQSLTVSPASTSILSLSSTNFQATGHYSDGSTADITSQAAWASSRADVATIAGGAATTLSQGTSSIRATLDGISGTSNLKVTGGNLTGITLSPVNPRLVKDTTGRMTASGSFSNGTSRDITDAVEWTLANTAIANVTTPGGNLAWLNALAVTPASAPVAITAKSGTITASTNLTVTAPLLQSITIFPSSLELTDKTGARFSVTAGFNDGTTQDVTANTERTSSAGTIASVANSGLAKGRVSAVAAGSATINAAYGGRTASAVVTVRTRNIQSLAISAASSVVVSGNQVKYTATANYSDGTSADVTEDSTWTIDKPNVAVLADSQNQPGQIVAVDSGSAILTAGFNGQTQTVTVTVP